MNTNKNVNPRGPSQRYPGSASPITKDPQGVDQGHQNSDRDSSIFAQHHSLGPTPNQASPGDHVHDGSNSKQINDLALLGILLAGNMAWGTVSITPSATGVPTSVPIVYDIKGTTFVGFASANTTVPGSVVQGVSMSGITGTGANVWATRSSLTATIVCWLVIGI
jgi:hypothetical protein